MKAEEFADCIARLAPSRSRLAEFEFSASFVDRLLEKHVCRPRLGGRVPEGAPQDALLTLLAAWDVSKVTVGQVEFLPEPEPHRDGWQVGYVESDPLVLRRDSEIVVYEHATDCHLLWRAARDGEHFLGALVTAEEYLLRRLLGDAPYTDLNLARSVAQACAAKAGGLVYLNFYLTLLG
jgi:hypothetical protein